MAETSTKVDEKDPNAPGNNGNAEQQTDTVAKAEYEKVVAEAKELREEKAKAELERNQKRNAAEKAEREKAENDKDFQKLYELMKQDVEEAKTKFESTTQTVQTEKAREDALAHLPEKLRASAKDLLAKAKTPEQVAEKASEVITLAKSLGIDVEELPESPVTVLNGRPKNNQGITEKTKTQPEWKEDLHSRLMKEAGIA